MHKALAHIAVAGLLALPPVVAAAEDIPPEKLAAIRELIQVTNAEVNSAAFASAFSQQMLSVLRANNPALPERAIVIVQDEVNRLVGEEMASESLQSLIYPIYARHFTLEELQGLIEFNRSPVGRKANSVMPSLMQESRTAAQAWSQSVGPRITQRVLDRFTAEGIELNNEAP